MAPDSEAYAHEEVTAVSPALGSNPQTSQLTGQGTDPYGCQGGGMC